MSSSLTPRARAFIESKISGKKAIQLDIVTAAEIRMQRTGLDCLKQVGWERYSMGVMLEQLSSRGLIMHRKGTNNEPLSAEEVMDLVLSCELQIDQVQAKAAQRAAQAQKTIADLAVLSVEDAVNAMGMGHPVDRARAHIEATGGKPPRRSIVAGGPNQFGQINPGFKDELFVAAELVLKGSPNNIGEDEIGRFLKTMGAPEWPYSFGAAWENWRRVHGYG